LWLNYNGADRSAVDSGLLENGSAEGVDLLPEEKERLRALGYVVK
jgi:hypothetical protein